MRMPRQDYDVRSSRRTSFMTSAEGATCGLPQDWPTCISKRLEFGWPCLEVLFVHLFFLHLQIAALHHPEMQQEAFREWVSATDHTHMYPLFGPTCPSYADFLGLGSGFGIYCADPTPRCQSSSIRRFADEDLRFGDDRRASCSMRYGAHTVTGWAEFQTCHLH